MKTITLIPLTVPEAVTNEAAAVIENCDMLYLQTENRSCSEYCLNLRKAAGKEYMSIADLCAESADSENAGVKLAERLSAAPYQNIGCAVLGGSMSAELMRNLRLPAKNGEFTVEALPFVRFGEAAFEKAVSLGFLDSSFDYNLRAAYSLKKAAPSASLIDISVPLIIEELDNPLYAGEIKLRLSEFYPAEHKVMLLPLANEAGNTLENGLILPLYNLDLPDNVKYFDTATALIVPPCEFTRCERHGMENLIQVMYALRAPGGCPWDAEQTHKSLRSSLLEETYEVLDAIDRNDLKALEEELGDLLLQVVFHTVIEEERGKFTIRDVITGLVNKLIYRHPHVFGDVKVKTTDDVLLNWENLKKKEKRQLTAADAMNAVPACMPALMRSAKIQKKAAHEGFDWDSPNEALEKVHEEAGEVAEALASGDFDAVVDETGDLLFACVNVARLAKVDAELALKQSTDKFTERFIRMERLIRSENKVLSLMNLAEMDIYWERIKKGAEYTKKPQNISNNT